MDSETTCSTCKFWVAMGGQFPDRGRCHRFPPIGNSGYTHFPVSGSEDFCGEHQPAEVIEP